MKKIIILILLFSFGISAQKENNKHASLTKKMEQIKNYYVSGKYDREIKNICEKAKEYFAKIPIKENSMVIFDVDDTALISYLWDKTFDFIWEDNPKVLQEKKQDVFIGVPILPVLDLYKCLIKQGFKIAFITARTTDFFAITVSQLYNAGYNKFEFLLLRPKFIKDKGLFKYQQRQMLSNYYDIVGCIGDKYSNCTFGLTGHKVIFPNYLY